MMKLTPPRSLWMRIGVMAYGVLSYLLCAVVSLYMLAFIAGIVVPRSLSSDPRMPVAGALLLDIALMILWGVQHSVMARTWFKDAVSRFVPQPIERSTYVLASSIVLGLLMHGWQPIGAVVWRVESVLFQVALWALFASGWVLVMVSTLLTDHFDLLGLRQAWLWCVDRPYTPVQFTQAYGYRWIRHPMMLGLLVSFWATPVMTLGHLVFSIGMSLYVLMGIHFEERAMAATMGGDYAAYQNRTARLIPKIY
jgi:protein-S-isoprenylcysteine O-methyltransferase Ste14